MNNHVMNNDNQIVKSESSPKSVKAWLESPVFQNAVKQSLPKHLTPERFVRVALTAMMRTPKLAHCTQQSLFKCLLDLSSLGLEPDGRRAHLIPFDNRKAGITECQLIIDYKGLIELAKRGGDVQKWRAELVCENDEFGWENGIVSHKIQWRKDRGKTDCVYSHVRNKEEVDDYEVMTIAEVLNIRDRSQGWKAFKAGYTKTNPWETDFGEMAKKTVIRRHSKRLNLSPEFMDALEKDFDRIDDMKSEAKDLSNDFMPKRISEKHKPEPEIEIEEEESFIENTDREPGEEG